MGITLNNTGDSGTVNITLDRVVDYIQSNINRFATKRIPGKTTPSIDTDTFIKNPRRYSIRARVTDSEKVTLETLNNEEDKQCKLTDGEQSNKNVRPIGVTFNNVPGNTTYPWVVSIELLAEDH